MSAPALPPPATRLLIRRYLPLLGGMERQADGLCARLAGRGGTIEVWTRWILPDTPAREQRRGYRIRRLRPGGLGRWGEYGSLPPLVLRLLIDRRRYEVLAVFGGGWLALAVALAAALAGRPWLLRPATAGDLTRFLDPAAVPAGGPLRKWLRGHLPPAAWRAAGLRRAAAAVAISEEIAKELEAWGFAPERIHRIPNGVDTARFAPRAAEERRRLRRHLDLPLEPPLALFLGRLVRRKGVLELAEAWRQLADAGRLPEDARLILAGSGAGQTDSVEPELRALAGRCPSILLPGPVERPEDWLVACDLFCLPSHYEGLSNALLEAMAAGRAILMSDLPANRAAAPPERCARVHPPGDPAALAEALEPLLLSPALRQRLGRAARQRALDRYDLDRAADHWSTLLSELARAHQHRPGQPA